MSAMEKSLEKYYMKFERPPLAPAFYPTEEEFIDPISYVAKIKTEAEKYGICKIVPPKSFHPPFCIDHSRFEFTPRVQRLNEIDALFRLRIIFINKLVNFWSLQGQQFRLPHSENRYVDLYRLRQLVKENGGMEQVTNQKRWCQIAKTLGFKPPTAPLLKQNYARWIHPFDESIGEDDINSIGEEPNSSSSNFSTTEILTNTNIQSNQSNSPEFGGGSRMMAGSSRMTSTASRMMAGNSKPKEIPQVKRKTFKKKLDIETVMCEQCAGGEDEHLLLLCDNCDRSFHTYCLVPPLTCVPKGEWRCPRCVAEEVRSQTFDFSFQDSQTIFNLSGFTEWANNFKRNYFKMPPTSVSGEKVEAAFWSNVIDLDANVQVKYGADLISSKVGSGFPRKDDCRKGLDTKAHQFYANHPWNLNNLPILRDSVLSHIDHGISGMMVPWVYVGMCFSTFCWHVEDHWTYSINFNHWGEKKIWYGIPGTHAEEFDKIMRTSAGELFVDQPDLLHSLTTTINPRYLIDQGVPVYTIHQGAGEFVITFPRAYHSGYNEGLNFAEAVNFAPPDWLYMGRLCLANYASVRRTCVFSHEELVMRMVSGAHKMSLSMCIATLDELRHIVTKETDFRKKLSIRGLRESQFCKFEIVHDDARSCHVCHTTLYISALVCRHENRVVCAEHIDQLCNECNIGNCCLKYRYTLSELIPLVHKLAERTNTFDDWRARAASACEPSPTSGKLDVSQLRLVLDQWRTKRYPQCDELRQASQLLSRYDKIATSVGKIINRKIRLRDNTRCQKADTRPEFSEVERLQQEIRESEFHDAELERALNELIATVQDWKTRATALLQSSDFETAASSELTHLLVEADEFTLKMPEYEELKSHLNRCQWLARAKKMVAATEFSSNILLKRQTLAPTTNKVESNDFLAVEGPSTKQEQVDEGIDIVYVSGEMGESESLIATGENNNKLDLNGMGKALAEGAKWSQTCPLVRKYIAELERMLTCGLAAEEKAQQFLSRLDAEGLGYEAAELCWKEFTGTEKRYGTEWLNSENFAVLRDEVELARQAYTIFQQVSESGFTLRLLEQAILQCERSLFERNGHRHRQLNELFNELNNFNNRLPPLFQRSHSGYANLFDIIAGRADLPALVEGDPVPLVLHNSTKYSVKASIENWRQLRLFTGQQDLDPHLDAVFRQQLPLFRALRLINERRPVQETCLCAKDKLSPKSSKAQAQSSVIPCFLCKATFHVSCIYWEPFLDRMPAGLYLCPRCLRGRRPSIQDVTAACSQAPTRSLEYCVVQKLLKHSQETFGKLQSLFQELPKGTILATVSQDKKTELEHALLHSLSLEIWDSSAYQTVFEESAYFELFPFSPENVSAWHLLQKRVTPATQRSVIFGPSSSVIAVERLEQTPAVNQRAGQRKSGRLAPGRGASPSPKRLRQSISEDRAQSVVATQPETKPKVVYHQDAETCAKNDCLRPYSDQVRWVQCGDDGGRGCGRWFHYVCVGLTVAQALAAPDWTCSECLNHGGEGKEIKREKEETAANPSSTSASI